VGFILNPLTGKLEHTRRAKVERLTKSFDAESNVSAIRMVKASSSTEVNYATSASTYEDSKAIGISLNAATTGNPVDVLLAGVIEDGTFTFGVNEVLYLTTAGGITDTPPSSGYSVVIGKGLGPGAIFIDIQEPILV
jgi:hypothetical protein